MNSAHVFGADNSKLVAGTQMNFKLYFCCCNIPKNILQHCLLAPLLEDLTFSKYETPYTMEFVSIVCPFKKRFKEQ